MSSDSLITILSEKQLPIPEQHRTVGGLKGFNLIATANTRDRGVNEISRPCAGASNTVVLPVPAVDSRMNRESSETARRVLGRALELPVETSCGGELRRIVTIFRELRLASSMAGQGSSHFPVHSVRPRRSRDRQRPRWPRILAMDLRPADLAAGLRGWLSARSRR
jgi:hypothetical protein